MAKQRAIERKRLQSIGNTYYEAAQQSGQRAQAFLAFPLTAEKEFSFFNRRTILKKKRYLEAQLSVIGALTEKVKKYTVGRGIIPMPCTLDETWNDQVTGDFIDWASEPNVCDAMGMQDFWEMQGWMAGSYFSEAEGFAALISSSQVDAPMLQLVDPGEVEYYASAGIPPALLPAGQSAYFDGVKLNTKGKIVGYAVRVTDGGGDQGTIEVDAPNMIHFCMRKRPNQYRGLSPFAGVANSGVDALDLRALEISSCKLHAALAVSYEKIAGPAIGPGGFSDQLKNLLATTVAESGQQQPNGQTVLGEDIFAGAMIKHLAPGEKLNLVSSNRPTVNTLHFLEWLYRDIAAGTGMSIELIWNLSALGGVNARINLADIQAYFDLIQGRLNSRFNQRVYIWWLSKKFQQGYPMPMDPKWWRCHWLGPAKITGDAGNTAKALVQLLNSGFGTWAEFWQSLGKSWKPQIRQRILEVKYAKEQCALEGVEYTDVFPPQPGAAASQGMGGQGGGTEDEGISTG